MSARKDTPFYSVTFVTVISLLCSILMAGFSEVLRRRIQDNASFEFKKNLLAGAGVFGKDLPAQDKVTLADVDKFFRDRVEVKVFDVFANPVQDDRPVERFKPWLDMKKLGPRKLDQLHLPVFRIRSANDPKKADKWIIPVWGKGLWGPLYGFLVLDASGTKVAGVSLLAPKETPGLGAEIEKDEFHRQWQGKQIFQDGKLTPIVVAKGSAHDFTKGDSRLLAHCVDGISGATLTCKGVTEMMNFSLKLYRPVLEKIVKGGI